MKKPYNSLFIKFIILLLYFFISNISSSQTFVKITDTSNPIVTDPGHPINSYVGCAWIDVDNDGWLDLYVCQRSVYRNMHNGNFQKMITGLEENTIGFSTTWADYNNDGFIDCFVTATSSAKSFLYKNNGNGTFTKITTGAIADSTYNTGWGCTWGDYNNDGNVDLVIAAANNFGIVHHPSRFWYNNGDGTFTKIDTTQFTMLNAPYTCPSFYDYDQDGDIDLFIGSGPATGTPARDYLYRNLLKEIGSPSLQRIDTSVIGTDLVDGQVWNFIDYDNDGDLDAYLTNYGRVNNLYRNEGNGYYVKMTQAQVGNIVNGGTLNLANVWGDFDNDGYIDCFVTRDASGNRFYHNNGDGTFTNMDTISIANVTGNHFGASAGDYDKDGKLDIFVTGPTPGLYRNIFPNNNKWVDIKCTGTTSNRSALGTRVKAKATFNGSSQWQTREINAANSFNSMNALNVHFGFGTANIIDSLVVFWPSGLRQTFTNVSPNNFYSLTEGSSITSDVRTISTEVPNSISLKQNYPNPFNPSTKIQFTINKNSAVSLKIFDVAGKEITELINSNYNTGTYEVDFNADAYKLASGIYFYTLTTDGYSETRKLNLIK